MRGRLGVLAVVLLAACSDRSEPTATLPIRPQASTIANVAHFSFLPPLASATITGAFNPNLLPVVEICQLTGVSCAVQLDRFETGPGGLTVDVGDEHYVKNWTVNNIVPGEQYRISVLAGPWSGASLLGSIDLQGTASGGLFNPANNTTAGAGSSLRIRFRLEHGLLCTTYLPDPNLNEPCVIAPVGPNGGTIVNADSSVGARIPAGALNQYVYVFLEQYEPFGSGSDALCLPSDFPQYGGCYRLRTEPDLASFQPVNGDTLPVTVGICPDPIVFQQGIFDQVDLYKWDEVDPSTLQPLPARQIDFLDCPGTPYSNSPAGSGFSASALAPFRSLARLLGHGQLYAGVISPFGGGLKDFSRIGWLRPLALSKVSGDGQQAAEGTAVANEPVVRVTAAGAKVVGTVPVAGVPVTFAASADGSVAPAATSTDAGGYASASWTLTSLTQLANTLTATAFNPLASASNTDIQNFPNRHGAWGSVSFSATSVTPPPPYFVVFLAPLVKGNPSLESQNVRGVPVSVQVCRSNGTQCWSAQRIGSPAAYNFHWKSPKGLTGLFTFTVRTGTVPLGTFTGAVGKGGSKPPEGAAYVFQAGSTVPIKFLLIGQ